MVVKGKKLTFKEYLQKVKSEFKGMTFRQKKLATRMDHARYLLQMTDMHVYEIAAATGYLSEAAFYKAFRNHYQITPQEYRSQLNHSQTVQP